jgi:hypothetical protein
LGVGRFLSRAGIGGSGLRITQRDSVCAGYGCGAMVGVALRNAITGPLTGELVQTVQGVQSLRSVQPLRSVFSEVLNGLNGLNVLNQAYALLGLRLHVFPRTLRNPG